MRFALFVVLVFLFSDAYSQDENVDVNLLIINDITGKELDATLTWYDPALVKKNGIGSFTLSLGQGREEVVLDPIGLLGLPPRVLLALERRFLLLFGASHPQ